MNIATEAMEDKGPASISYMPSSGKISWSIENARFVFKIVWALWNLHAPVLPIYLLNCKAKR